MAGKASLHNLISSFLAVSALSVKNWKPIADVVPIPEKLSALSACESRPQRDDSPTEYNIG
jgi:hypothetical protein